VLEALENAPFDDGLVQEEEKRLVEEARAALRAGAPTIPYEDIERSVRERLARGE
jgi:hypothetical protein